MQYLVDRKCSSHGLHILQDTQVIRSFAGQQHGTVSVKRVARVADLLCRKAALTVSQRTQDALIVVWIITTVHRGRERGGERDGDKQIGEFEHDCGRDSRTSRRAVMDRQRCLNRCRSTGCGRLLTDVHRMGIASDRSLRHLVRVAQAKCSKVGGLSERQATADWHIIVATVTKSMHR